MPNLVFENRETGEIELYLTRYGERASHRTHADAYKYTITLLKDIGTTDKRTL